MIFFYLCVVILALGVSQRKIDYDIVVVTLALGFFFFKKKLIFVLFTQKYFINYF
ncbi:hypothetical protein HanIR_Chr04g0171151 [Helianthus annuus]|nr:hypothetical protein HanIR_Chr04g0171151 [Helianthus annuus]